jgi:hypothetical protein
MRRQAKIAAPMAVLSLVFMSQSLSDDAYEEAGRA